MKICLGIVAAFGAALSSPASSNVLIPMSLDVQAGKADLVIVGRAHEPRACTSGVGVVDCVRISDASALKGVIPEGEVLVLLDIGINESKVTNVIAGSEYLLFLRKQADGRFVAVNGRYSVLKVDR